MLNALIYQSLLNVLHAADRLRQQGEKIADPLMTKRNWERRGDRLIMTDKALSL